MSGRGGTVLIWERDRRPLFCVKATGYVGPPMLAQELQKAAKFAPRQNSGWTYLVDTSEVRKVNPLNALALRRIPKLPYIRRYVVIVPSFLLRVGAKLSSWIVKPDHFVASVQQASDVIASADTP